MENHYPYILMDLDGTVTDPMTGITRCVQYALKHWGIEENELQKLCGFIGPPLSDAFQEFYGFTKEQAEEAILKYRERFVRIGMYENKVYPGMAKMLSKLKDEGKKVMLATSKPEGFARKILEHFRLAPYFDYIGGATLDGSRSHKKEVIAYVLETCRINDRAGVVMVGDRKYDIEGARQLGLDTIGVTYGYGSRKELEEAGADRIVDSVEELGYYLKCSFKL